MTSRETPRRDRLTPTQARAARRARRQRRRRLVRFAAFFAVAVVALIFIVSLFAGSLPFTFGGSSPGIGDHWHASYEVSVCGETRPPVPTSSGGVHSHGDAAVHIHPQRPAESGSNATFARFYESAGGELKDDGLTLPSGQTYTNGDLCPDDRPGQLAMTVNGVSVEEPSLYAPRDEDVISISFQAVGQP